MIDTGLRGKVALITGANHGIGAAVAGALAAEGAAVFITYMRIEPWGGSTGSSLSTYESHRAQNAEQVVAAIRTHGGRVEALELDLADATAVPRLFDRVTAALGPVEVLVNNAAVGGAPRIPSYRSPVRRRTASIVPWER